MSLLKSKQIEKVLTGYIGVAAVASGAAGSRNVTTDITTALATAGNGGIAVSLQVSTSINAGANLLEKWTPGVITLGSNRTLIYSSGTKQKLIDGSGNEIYGRITEAAGVYTLTYYSEVAGVETPYTFTGSVNIDYLFAYRFRFAQFPADATIRVFESFVGEDPLSVGGRKVMEVLTITATNTINSLTLTPTANTVQLFVNGIGEDQLAGGAFSVTGLAITWNPVTAGYDLDTVDRAVVIYQTLA